MARRRSGPWCSFCGRHQTEVVTLILGAGGVAICDQCVAEAQIKIANIQHALGTRPAIVTTGSR